MQVEQGGAVESLGELQAGVGAPLSRSAWAKYQSAEFIVAPVVIVAIASSPRLGVTARRKRK